MSPNLLRLIALSDETFAAHADERQLQVDEDVMARLEKLHPATLSEYATEEGPAIWVLAIPTTETLMEEFLSGALTETELLDLTPLDVPYEALYLCSALTLPEFRHQGLTKKLALEAIAAIRTDHPIKTLFAWYFTQEGGWLANAIAQVTGLPLRERKG